jgi:hypothetical protein
MGDSLHQVGFTTHRRQAAGPSRYPSYLRGSNNGLVPCFRRGLKSL